MVHHEQLGRFDHDALRRSLLVVRDPLDVEEVDHLFRKFGDILPSGERTVDGHIFTLHPDGYVEYLTPGNRPRVVEFIVRLARETGSAIVNAEWGSITSPDELAAAFERNHRHPIPA